MVLSVNLGIFNPYLSRASPASIVEPPPIPINPTLREAGKCINLKAEAKAVNSIELLTKQQPVCLATDCQILLFPAKPPV